jgi:hypothetical protein
VVLKCLGQLYPTPEMLDRATSLWWCLVALLIGFTAASLFWFTTGVAGKWRRSGVGSAFARFSSGRSSGATYSMRVRTRVGGVRNLSRSSFARAATSPFAADAGNAGPRRTSAAVCHDVPLIGHYLGHMEGLLFLRDPKRVPGDLEGYGLLRVRDQCRRWDSYPATSGVTAPRIEMRWDSYPGAGCHSSPYCLAIEAFGNPVPAVVHTSPDRFLVRGSVALAKIVDEWMFAEYVNVGSPSARLDDGRPSDILNDQMPELRKAKITLVGDPFDGAPPALGALLTGIVASGNECVPYHQHWVRTSGISPHAAIATEHSALFSILSLMICFDLLNVLSLTSAELVARRILTIERAVKRSAKSPDFEGLDVLSSNQFDSNEGVLTRVFDKYISEIQKNDDIVLKQQRSYREKAEAGTKRKGKNGPRFKEGVAP